MLNQKSVSMQIYKNKLAFIKKTSPLNPLSIVERGKEGRADRIIKKVWPPATLFI